MSPPDNAHERPNTERLLELIDAMSGRPVVVLADLVADRFVTGTPKRISREAPVLILRHEGERLAPGGGANAVANLAALGARVLPLGLVGDDENGRALVDELARLGVETAGIRVRSGYRTPTKTRILGGARGGIKQQIVRYDVEDTVEPSDDDRRAFAQALADWPNARVAVVSDYGYGAVDEALVALLRQTLGEAPDEEDRDRSPLDASPGDPGTARADGDEGDEGDEPWEATVLLDSRYRLGSLGVIDGATPNEEEAEALHGAPLDQGLDGDAGRRAVDAAGRALLERLGSRFLLVTRGSRGMVLLEPGRPSAHLPVHGTAQVADVTGAGDTVIATFSLALAAGASPLEAAALANYAGGVVVMKMGTATLDPDELREAVRSDPTPLEEIRWVAS